MRTYNIVIMGKQASRTRAYNKNFDANEWLQKVGAARRQDGLWEMPGGVFISAYPGRPGKVGLMLQPKEGGVTQRVFGVNEVDDMKAFAEGRPTKADQRAALVRAAPDLLAACEAALRAIMPMNGFADTASTLRAAIKKAKGEPS